MMPLGETHSGVPSLQPRAPSLPASAVRESLELVRLTRQGRSVRDGLIIAAYGVCAPLRMLRKALGKTVSRRLAAPVTLENRDGLFHCGRSFNACRIASSFYEQNLRPHIRIDRGVFVDIGAHIGKYTVRLAHRIGRQGTVVAVEPEPWNFATLMTNIHLNQLENVIPVQAACTEKNGNIPLHVHDTYSTLHSTAIEHGGNAILVQAFSLDTLLDELALEGVDLIKIDVEGGESAVLKGAEKTLRRYHPVIVFEAWGEKSRERIRRQLAVWGYGVHGIDATNHIAK